MKKFTDYMNKNAPLRQNKSPQIKTLDHGDFKLFFKPLQGRNLDSNYGDKYGDKIPTNYIAEFGNKKYRVYMIQWSNSGSPYIIVNNEKYFLPSGISHQDTIGES